MMNLTAQPVMLDNPQSVTAVDVSADGLRVLFGQYAHTSRKSPLTVWSADLYTCEFTAELQPYEGVLTARFAGKGDIVAFVSNIRGFSLLETATGTVVVQGIGSDRLTSIAAARTGDAVAVGGDRVIVVSISGEVLLEMRAKDAMVALDSTGTTLAVSGAAKHQVAVVSVDSGNFRRAFSHSPAQLRWIGINGDGTAVVAVTASSEGAYAWDVSSGKRLAPNVLNEASHEYWSGAFADDGRRVFLGTLRGSIVVIDLDRNLIEHSQRLCGGRIWDMSIVGRTLAFGGDNGGFIGRIE